MIDSFGFSSALFTIVPILVTIGFITVFGIVIYRLVQTGRQWKRNNDSPVLTVDATIATKRMDVSNYQHASMTNNTMDASYSTSYYYVTFQVASGDRMEFEVQSEEYGMLAEGDRGKLTFQGTRFLGYVREL